MMFVLMVGRGCFARIELNGPPCTRSGFDLQRMAEIWFLGTADQPTFATLKQIELTSVVP